MIEQLRTAIAQVVAQAHKDEAEFPSVRASTQLLGMHRFMFALKNAGILTGDVIPECLDALYGMYSQPAETTEKPPVCGAPTAL